MPNEKIRERNIECALQHAYRLFLENGIEQTTIEMLARSAGISRSSLDRYFCSKLDLVVKTAMWVSENIKNQSASISPLFNDSKLTGLEMLKDYLNEILELLNTNPQLFVLSIEFRSYIFRSGERLSSISDMIRNCLGSSLILEKIFERGIDDGSIKPDSDSHTEAVITRESTLGFFSSIALADETAMKSEHGIAELYVERVVARYRNS